MGAFYNIPNTLASGGSSSSAKLGARLAYASPAGLAVAAAPAGFSSTTGRLYVTLAAGDATWTSLTAGGDGQLLSIINNDAANTLTLAAAAFAANGLILPAGHRALLFYDTTAGSWEIANG